MSAGAQTRGWAGPSRRRVPRFAVQTPLDVTVLRSGVPDTVPGRSLNLCERGVAAMMAGELMPGESVGVEVKLPAGTEPLRARATVKYQDRLRCGMEFLGLTLEQRAAIRDWAKAAKVQPESLVISPVAGKSATGGKGATADPGRLKAEKQGGSGSDGTGKKPRRAAWIVLLIIGAVIAAGVWWRWNRAWNELEAGLKPAESAAVERPQAQVPAEVMEKLLVHRVEPTYPAEARQQNVQGIIALDIVVGRDGSVVSMKALNGPEVLARAAMDALRWWKFEPYRVNGELATVETTVAVEFKR